MLLSHRDSRTPYYFSLAHARKFGKLGALAIYLALHYLRHLCGRAGIRKSLGFLSKTHACYKDMDVQSLKKRCDSY